MSNDHTQDGSLLLNGNEQIKHVNDSEFGIDYRVKPRTTCYLYSRLPDMVNVHDAAGTITSINGPKPYPATYQDSRLQTVGILDEVQPNQLMLARAIPMYPEFMEVIIYESTANVDPNMPETGSEIKICQRGFVSTENIQPLRKEKVEYVPMSAPVFPNQVLLEDVKQFRFGDCFLLASILSILAKPNGENIIRSMMVSDGDHTIVKLFHPETKEPHFIRVRNTSFHAQKTNYNRHQAPWVHILEKAYTAFAFINDKSQSYPSFKEIFGNGGFSKTALPILTGNASHEEIIPDVWENSSPIHYFTNKNAVNHDASPLQIGTKWKFLNEQFAGGVPVDLRTVNALLDDNEQLQQLLQTQLNDYAAIFSVIVDSYKEFKQSEHPLRSIILNLQDYIELNSIICNHIMNGAAPAGLFDKSTPFENLNAVYLFLDDLNAKKLLPMKYTERMLVYAQQNSDKWTNPNRGDYYTAELNALYGNINSALISKSQVVTASTKAKFDEKIPGLRNRHAYAVIGTEEKETNGVTHKYIVLRNPWGRVGRGYANELNHYGLSVAANEIEDATFRVELTDFQRYFRSYTTGNIPAVTKADVNISNLLIGTELLYAKVEKIRLACDQFKKDLISKLSDADSDKATVKQQINIIEQATAELNNLSKHSTQKSLKTGIQNFQSVIFRKDNIRTIQKSNDSAGKIFLQVIATILSLGIMYDRFFNKTHQKTFIRELDRVSTLSAIRS